MSYVMALVLTLAIEVPLAWAWCTRWRGGAGGQAVLVGLGASLVTHPLLWFGWLPAMGRGPGAVLLGEALVVVAETGIWRGAAGLSWRDALLLGLGTNLVSATLGSVLYAWLVAG